MEKLQCILLIDDSRASNYLHKSLLEELGVARQVAVVRNGQHALTILEAQDLLAEFPEIILLDLAMPVMDGFTFLDTYQSRGYFQKYPSLLAMLASSPHWEDLRRLQQWEAIHYLPKPLTEMDVRTLVALYKQKNQMPTQFRR